MVPVNLPREVELLIETAGRLAAAAGRPLDDCPYSDLASDAVRAWSRGWIETMGTQRKKAPTA